MSLRRPFQKYRNVHHLPQHRFIVMVKYLFILGLYWIDPNGGITNDAIKVYCEFHTNASCLYPGEESQVSDNCRFLTVKKSFLFVCFY